MKLLLTSSGLRNDELRSAFLALLPLDGAKIKVAVIPTAAKHEEDRTWFDKDIKDLQSTGVGSIEMVDISELDKNEWLPKLEASDVIFVEGGDVYFLRDWVVKSGLGEELPRLLQSKVYVGVSAGTRLLNPDISIAALYFTPDKDPKGLAVTNFCVVPHMNSPHFPDRTTEKVAPQLTDFPYKTYLIDDNTAILIQDNSMSFVGGGEYKEFN